MDKEIDKEERKLRIAICLSGFVRTWEHVKKSFLEKLCKNDQKNIEFDVFIHTYKQNYYESTSGKQDVMLRTEDFVKLFSGLNVKEIVVEDREELLPGIRKEAERFSHISNFGFLQRESSDEKSISIPIGVRTYDHMRKLHLCNELKKTCEEKNNFKYDLVVKTRFDIIYFNTPKWEQCIDNRLHFGYGATWGWPEDTFCVSSSDNMDKYLGRFKLFDEMYKDSKIDGICSHGSLKYVIEKYSLDIGNPVVNILCFRSENSVQYNGNYRHKCNIDWLYNEIDKCNVNDIYEIENIKKQIM